MKDKKWRATILAIEVPKTKAYTGIRSMQEHFTHHRAKASALYSAIQGYAHTRVQISDNDREHDLARGNELERKKDFYEKVIERLLFTNRRQPDEI